MTSPVSNRARKENGAMMSIYNLENDGDADSSNILGNNDDGFNRKFICSAK